MPDEESPNRGAQLLRKWRKEHGLTQASACLMVGCDFSMFSKFENGHRLPGYRRAQRIEEGTKGAVPMQAWAKPGNREKKRKAAA